MKGWIIGLVAVGVVIAVGIGFASNSQSVAEKRYCNDLETLHGVAHEPDQPQSQQRHAG